MDLHEKRTQNGATSQKPPLKAGQALPRRLYKAIMALASVFIA
jgi:hypothetical protein